MGFPDFIPNGLAEAVVLITVAGIFAWYMIRKDIAEKKESPREAKKVEDDARCALAAGRAEAIMQEMKHNVEQRRKLEEDLQNMNKILVKIVEDNTRAITMLCDRVR